MFALFFASLACCFCTRNNKRPQLSQRRATERTVRTVACMQCLCSTVQAKLLRTLAFKISKTVLCGGGGCAVSECKHWL